MTTTELFKELFLVISKSAIPVLVLLPEHAHTDYKTLFSIATAYAYSGLLVSEHAKKTDRLEFTFPAIVCSSFSIELFLKFFLMLEIADSNKPSCKKNFGHGLLDLWSQNLGNLKHQNMADGVKKSWEDPVVRAQRSKREGV
jgi:hypothetical protein